MHFVLCFRQLKARSKVNIENQRQAVQLFVDTVNCVENIDGKHPMVPHVFSVYRAYNNLDAETRAQKSFADFISEIAVELELQIVTLESLTRFKVPNKAASVCPIIPGLTIAKATTFLLGLMPAAAKYRRDCKTAVRKGMAKLETLFGIDETTIETTPDLQLAE